MPCTVAYSMYFLNNVLDFCIDRMFRLHLRYVAASYRRQCLAHVFVIITCGYSQLTWQRGLNESRCNLCPETYTCGTMGLKAMKSEKQLQLLGLCRNLHCLHAASSDCLAASSQSAFSNYVSSFEKQKTEVLCFLHMEVTRHHSFMNGLCFLSKKLFHHSLGFDLYLLRSEFDFRIVQ